MDEITNTALSQVVSLMFLVTILLACKITLLVLKNVLRFYFHFQDEQ